MDSELLMCSFDGTTVPAKWVSGNELLCTSPKRQRSSLAAQVQVHNAGDPFVSNGLAFDYYRPWRLHSVKPTFGPSNGGTTLRVRGVHFRETESLLCDLDMQTSVANYISSTEIACTTPLHAPGLCHCASP